MMIIAILKGEWHGSVVRAIQNYNNFFVNLYSHHSITKRQKKKVLKYIESEFVIYIFNHIAQYKSINFRRQSIGIMHEQGIDDFSDDKKLKT